MSQRPDSKRVLPEPIDWVEHFGDELYRYAFSHVGDAHVAEDLVQEVFLAGLQSQQRYAERAAPLTWLTSILRHKVADHFRRQQRTPRTESDDTAPVEDVSSMFTKRGIWRTVPPDWGRSNPEENLSREDFWETINQCVAKLSPVLASVFRMRELDGLDLDDLCQRLCIERGTATVRLHRARLQLRECLERNWFRVK